MIFDLMIYHEMRRAVRGREKEIIILYYDYGYKEREIAKIIGVSRQRIGQIKKRAIERMRECI